MAIKKETLQLYKDIINRYSSAKEVPRNQDLWPHYLRDLRRNFLGLTQHEFWGLVDVKVPTGSKYEKHPSSGSDSRPLPMEKMVELMSVLDLVWEKSNRYVIQNGESEALTSEGIQALNLLSHYDIDLEDLEQLLDLHHYYEIKRTLKHNN